MEKINIGGYEFCNFGSNNYSNGMELITSTDRPLEIIEKVKLQEPGFECVWFNPSAPCSEFEFFGVLGTEEQYKKFYKTQKNALIGEAMVNKFGFGGSWPEEAKDYENELRKNYKDWWVK